MEKRIKKLHVILAITLLFTPLVLIIATSEIRSSEFTNCLMAINLKKYDSKFRPNIYLY